MKSAIYIENELLQFVLTPENEFEKNILNSFYNKQTDAKVYNGSFYDCRGGWMRQTAFFPRASSEPGDKSLILTIKEKKD